MERRISREETKHRAGRLPVGSAAFSHASDARNLLQLNEFAWSKIEPLYLKRRSLKIVMAQFLILSFYCAIHLSMNTHAVKSLLNYFLGKWMLFKDSLVRTKHVCVAHHLQSQPTKCTDTMRPTCSLNESFCAHIWSQEPRASMRTVSYASHTSSRRYIRTLTAEDFSYDYLVQLIRNA